MKKHYIPGILALGLAATAVFLSNQRVGPSYLYPRADLTPGKVATQDFQELTQTKNCGTYSQCHRDTTQAQKNQVCTEYPQNCSVPHEIDHVIPLALGGEDTVQNLWAQPEQNNWNGKNWGFHEKDRIETYLVNQMKAGKITPKDAQQCLEVDWIKCYNVYIGKTLGVSIDPDQ